jgi:hypothetical protein
VPFAASTKNTRYIVSRGTNAVPLLVAALKDNQKPMLVGNSAFCLWCIKSVAGKEEASMDIINLEGKGIMTLSIQEKFALHELLEYRSFVEDFYATNHGI